MRIVSAIVIFGDINYAMEIQRDEQIFELIEEERARQIGGV